TFASRRYLQHLIEIYFPPESSGFLQALLLGIRSHLSREVKFNFQRAGVMHVLAISGLHVGFIALSFGIILSFLPLYFKYRYPLIMLLLLFYMFLTGCQPPVVRATIMTVFFLLSRILEKPLNIYNSIFAAAFVILFFQPQQLFWVGFQFSFAAVLSIIFFYERLSPWVQLILDKCKNDWLRNRLFRWIIIPLLVSFSAQLGTVPLVMYYFHLFSPIALILNLIVIPLTGILVAGGLLFFLISFISHEVTILIADFIHQIIQLLIKLVQIPLTIPGAYLWIPRFSLIHILLYGFLLFSLIELLARRRTFIYPLIMAGILMIGNWTFREIMKTPSLQILVLDVGQGDASLILTPSGKLVCIDTGPANQYYDAARHAIIPTLQYLGKKKINYLFISHPHDDHCGGTFNLTTYATIDSAYLPRMPMGYPMADSLKQFWETHHIPYRYLSMGDQINVDNETRIYVLSPPSQFTNYHDFDGSHVNNNSLILLIKHRDLSLLFPGDAEWPVEEALTGWKKILRANFLKVAHHGSNTSSSDAFLNLVSPSIAVISVGKNNKFHHPSPRVIRRLKNHNVQIHRTDVEKALWFEWFNGKLRLKKW
ncbi:MAG: DNA internalization-related competence protein ComEC/Rec2, partial [Calditrichaeota bacterium]